MGENSTKSQVGCEQMNIIANQNKIGTSKFGIYLFKTLYLLSFRGRNNRIKLFGKLALWSKTCSINKLENAQIGWYRSERFSCYLWC